MRQENNNTVPNRTKARIGMISILGGVALFAVVWISLAKAITGDWRGTPLSDVLWANLNLICGFVAYNGLLIVGAILMHQSKVEAQYFTTFMVIPLFLILLAATPLIHKFGSVLLVSYLWLTWGALKIAERRGGLTKNLRYSHYILQFGFIAFAFATIVMIGYLVRIAHDMRLQIDGFVPPAAKAEILNQVMDTVKAARNSLLKQIIEPAIALLLILLYFVVEFRIIRQPKRTETSAGIAAE
ncbi:MAG: hypothetical protein M1485_00950 [Chloroflexi bacterium]|nr:hypothetical protein [Chloroflexota bacterium]